MLQNLQTVIDLISNNNSLSQEEKTQMIASLKEADKKFSITEFKLDRTEKVKRTTAILLEETIEELEQKRKAVEAQNRELEIENALEKVRAIALSMNQPADMLKVCHVISEQLALLKVDEVRNVQTAIIHEDKGTYLNYEYYIKHDKSLTTEVDYKAHDLSKVFANKMLKGAGELFIETLDKKALDEWYAYQKTTNQFVDSWLEKAESLSYYFFSLGPVALGISTYVPLTDDNINLFKRFRNVFELAYRRFLDIQKAEAQAREAQIELALERVRARTMAMQHSGELADASFLLDSQVRALGIKTWGCAFNIYGENESTEWFSSKAGTMPAYKTPREKIFLRYYEAGQRGEAMHIEEYAGETCVAHYNYLCTVPVMGDALKEVIANGGSFPTCQIDHATYFKYGYLLFITFEPVPDAHDIFIRFAKVFEQTYTRFLDLQKAEAQARESQIQLALERVRARTMAMQKSDELSETASEMFQQIQSLGLKAWSCGFNIIDKEKRLITQWVSSGDGRILPSFVTPSDEDVFKRFTQAAEKDKSLYVEEMGGEALKAHYQYMASLPEVKKLLVEFQSLEITPPDFQVFHLASFSYGYLMFITYQPALEFYDVFKRFATVFDQTYTRFLDLQKAEAQARESQIQLALERVRARTMAMQNSHELAEVSSLLFQQMKSLGVESYSSGFTIWDIQNNNLISWMCNADGSMNPPFVMPIAGDAWHARQFQSWKNGEEFIVHDFSGADLQLYFQYLRSYPLLDEAFNKSIAAGHPMPERQVHNVSNFSHGNILFITLKPCIEAHHILRRFAKVFEQTYTRFLDLEKAEAQARESQIEAALERVRSRSLAMHKTSEIQEVIHTVHDELLKLNISIVGGSFIVINKDVDAKLYAWGSGGTADTTAEMLVPDFGMPFCINLIKGIKKGSGFFTEEFSRQEKIEYFTELFKHEPWSTLPAKEKQAVLESEGAYTRSVSVSKHTSIFIINQNGRKFTEAENDIVKRFAKVFEQAYTRFLDLQKAEAQAREALIEAALERVRSRTLAMQKSEELAETSAVLFKQLILLGISPNRLYISIIKDDVGNAEFWITDEDGGKVSMAYEDNLNTNVAFKKMYAGWKQQKKSLIIDMQGEELEAYFQHLSSIHVLFKGGLTQKRRLQHIAYFSKGFIGMASPDEQPAETLQLLERFAYVFNLTFTRFSDLKIAEAHALQAEQDLIEIKSARQKAENALSELQSTQKQLIQSEKMASLGELTAGIAHEIQNPLNFVNNFSEVSNELIDEINEEIERGNTKDVKVLLIDIKQNLEKINHHGKRADAIVKGMLQHSRQTKSITEPTDINVLTDEYIRLCFHGLRAKDKSFNSNIQTDFDSSIENINIIPQDIGRVLLNVLTNAFYAVNEKKEIGDENYQPTVSVQTKKLINTIEIRVTDNGNGIPQNIIYKIFQPFFTTKPTGQGTGLGLSLSYDIIKAHGGEIKVETKEGEGTEFIIKLPVYI